jgi:hypothetical protein
MSSITGPAISAMPSSLAGSVALLPATPPLGKGQKAARDFEAQLLAMLLEPLEKTFAALPGQDAIAGQDDYNYLGIQALSSGLAAAGGFGIARLIAPQLEGTKGGAPIPPGAKSPTPEKPLKLSLSVADGIGWEPPGKTAAGGIQNRSRPIKVF